MNRLAKPKDIFRTFLQGAAITVIALAALASGTAFAACGPTAGAKPLHFPALPLTAQSRPVDNQNNGRLSIVGLWQVTYVSGGQLFFNSLEQWHSDGTEFENANVNPTEGNVCFGVWQTIAPGTVKLHHIGWNFDANGNSIGTFTIDEINTVAWDGATYQGTFDYKVYDVDGNLVFEATGTQTANRITVI